jgi:pimeloyl-ACP methyl ester carboxylesterase
MNARASRTSDEGIWSHEVGDGPLVALVHGAMDRSGGMLRVSCLLQATCRVLRYDRRGYARSQPAGPPTSFDQQVDDLVGLLDGRLTVLAGHSFGGVVCLAAAQRHPELVPAVLAYEAPRSWAPWWPGASGRSLGPLGTFAPAGTSVGTDPDPGDLAEAFLRRMIGDATWERLPAAMRAERRAEGSTLLAETRSVRPPHPPPYDEAAITVPVVAAHGSETRPHHVRGTELLARTAPRGELRVVEGAGHGAHLTHPREFADLVGSALDRAGLRPVEA